jgi:hypothetical protein
MPLLWLAVSEACSPVLLVLVEVMVVVVVVVMLVVVLVAVVVVVVVGLSKDVSTLRCNILKKGVGVWFSV